MEYYDEEILEARWEEERRKHTTLETGIYVEDELITFSQIILPNTKILLYLPEQFFPMPESVIEGKNDVDAKQTDLNLLLDKYNLTATQQEYDMLLSLIYNTGSGILSNSDNKQTKRWFETGGYTNGN